jgi:Outer membrane protein beta-barrel domain
MKKLLLAGLLLLGFESAHAQFSAGLKAGLNYANISGNMGTNQNFDRDRKLGFNAGVVANIKAIRSLAIQPELLFSTKGYEVDQTTTNGDLTTKTEVNSRMKYLDLPVMIQLQQGQFYLEAGPQASFLLKQETRTHQVTTESGLLSDEVVQDQTTTSTDKGAYKTPDMGYAAGLGFRSSNNMVSFGLRYSHSLGTIFKDNNTDARTSLLQVSITSNLPFFGE